MPVALVAPFAPSRRRVAACGSRSVVILRSPPVEAGGSYCLTKKPIRYLGSPLGLVSVFLQLEFNRFREGQPYLQPVAA